MEPTPQSAHAFIAPTPLLAACRYGRLNSTHPKWSGNRTSAARRCLRPDQPLRKGTRLSLKLEFPPLIIERNSSDEDHLLFSASQQLMNANCDPLASSDCRGGISISCVHCGSRSDQQWTQAANICNPVFADSAPSRLGRSAQHSRREVQRCLVLDFLLPCRIKHATIEPAVRNHRSSDFNPPIMRPGSGTDMPVSPTSLFTSGISRE